MDGSIIAFTSIIGGLAFLLAYSPLGRAWAERLRGGRRRDDLPEMVQEMDELRAEVGELQERIEFMERLITDRASTPETTPVGDGGHAD
jgi:hypothetical protein